MKKINQVIKVTINVKSSSVRTGSLISTQIISETTFSTVLKLQTGPTTLALAIKTLTNGGYYFTTGPKVFSN